MKEELLARLQCIDQERLKARAAVLRDYAEDAAAAARDYAGEAVGQADRFIDYTMGRARGFSVLDFAIFKVCLICFGAWLASLFSKAAQKLKPLFLIGFLATWFYLIWRIFFCETDD